jgi:transaldolase
MALFLDSASLEDARRSVELGFVWGATTNPVLMARVERDPADVIADLCELLPGAVVYQLAAPTLSQREAEALRIFEINPAQIILSVPCTTENLALVARLTDDGITCAVTAIFGTYQAYLACEAGAHFIVPTVNRITRLQGDGAGLVSEMINILEAAGTDAELLATDITTPGEVIETVLAGAHHLSLSLDLILSLGEHPLSQQAIADFEQALR